MVEGKYVVMKVSKTRVLSAFYLHHKYPIIPSFSLLFVHAIYPILSFHHRQCKPHFHHSG